MEEKRNTDSLYQYIKSYVSSEKGQQQNAAFPLIGSDKFKQVRLPLSTVNGFFTVFQYWLKLELRISGWFQVNLD